MATPKRRAVSRRYVLLLLIFSFFLLTSHLRPASISALKFEGTYKEKIKTGQRIAAIVEGKIMNLSVETKVAIAVATSFILLIVGAIAQG